MKSVIGKSLKRAASILRDGGVVAIPTETVYGLAGNALLSDTVTKIFDIKNRPAFDPLILHTDSLSKISHLTKDIPAPILKLAEVFMPGPLSIILEKTELVPDITTSGLSTVAIRIPDHPLTLELLSMLDFPLAAPSANPFGYVSPTKARHVADQLGTKIPYILNGGNCAVGIESTIVSYRDHRVTVLRKGGISIENIEQIVGEVVVKKTGSSRPDAPGMLESHYAPVVPLKLTTVEQVLEIFDVNRIGYLGFQKKTKCLPSKSQKVLSSSGNLSEAASNLFSHLRALDGMDIDIIISSLVPEQGLGRAINDKLRRAAGS